MGNGTFSNIDVLTVTSEHALVKKAIMDIALVASALAKPTIKLILETLASRKRAQLYDIVAILKQQNPDSSDAEVLSSLSRLKVLKLVVEKAEVLPRSH